jgi:hypothetical protein
LVAIAHSCFGQLLAASGSKQAEVFERIELGQRRDDLLVLDARSVQRLCIPLAGAARGWRAARDRGARGRPSTATRAARPVNGREVDSSHGRDKGFVLVLGETVGAVPRL